jgi:hypothetical protein
MMAVSLLRKVKACKFMHVSHGRKYVLRPRAIGVASGEQLKDQVEKSENFRIFFTLHSMIEKLNNPYAKKSDFSLTYFTSCVTGPPRKLTCCLC